MQLAQSNSLRTRPCLQHAKSDASVLVVRRTFVEISEPEDENRRGGSCPPNISRDKVGTRMAAEALLGVCHKMKAELIHGKATGQNQKEALVEGHGDEDKVLTESQDEDRAKALPPFPVFRHKGIGCSEAPKLKERKKVRVTTITIIMKRLLDRLVNLSTQEGKRRT